jgi:hypothetical protein
MIEYGPIYQGASFPLISKRRTPFIGETWRYTWSPTSNSIRLCLLSVQLFWWDWAARMFAWIYFTFSCDRVVRRVSQRMTSWYSLGNCCYTRTQLVTGACPISDHPSEHKYGAYLRWVDWFALSVRLSGGDRLSFWWGGCPNTHVVAPKTEQQR